MKSKRERLLQSKTGCHLVSGTQPISSRGITEQCASRNEHKPPLQSRLPWLQSFHCEGGSRSERPTQQSFMIRSRCVLGIESGRGGFGEATADLAAWFPPFSTTAADRSVLRVGDGVTHGNSEASATHQGNIRKVIPDISDSRI